ncbi:RNA polymerase II-associated protein 3 [Ditylenchus destructor]|uniref:RNA polymerase II-associated protein 3 n=1 Tax=Ditylenchus destructor TaxID=166010 RepID=A0AAD4NG83_9BILA|nr:RNA polymerase II-associated protein 3 [Ditylenchus destructor]
MNARGIEKAISLKQQGDFELAQRSYKTAIDLYSKAMSIRGYSAPLVNRALAHAALKKYKEALVDSNAALAINNTQISACHCKIIALFGLERVDEALNEVERCVEIEVSEFKPESPVPDENVAPNKSRAVKDNGKSDETVAKKNDPKQRLEKVTVGQKRMALRSRASFENADDTGYAPKTEKIKKASGQWQVGDLVLCNDEPDSDVRYEAKIIDVSNDASGQLAYKLHYKGFNSKYDESIAHNDAKNRFMAATAANKKKVKEVIDKIKKEAKNGKSGSRRSVESA